MLLVDILEARRNPEINQKVSAMDALRKYAGQNVFVTFTHDVGKDSHKNVGDRNAGGAKIGINPKTTYNTPVGIYAYPVSYVLSKKGSVEFAGDRPYMWVFEPTGRVLDLATYSEADLVRDVKTVRDKVSLTLINTATKTATIETPGGKFWNITRLLAIDKAKQALVHKAERDADDREHKAYLEFIEDVWPDIAAEIGVDEDDENAAVDEFREWYEARDDGSYVGEDESEAASPPFWNRVFRDMGYCGVVDSDGEGIIHENEPTQGVFFSKTDIKVLELVRNIAPRAEPLEDIGIWHKQPRALLALLRSGKMSDERLIEILREHPSLLAALGFENIPPVVQEYVRNHVVRFMYNSFSNLKLADMGLNDEQMIRLISSVPGWATQIPKLTPALKNYLMTHIMEFLQYIDRLPLNDADKVAIFDTNPSAYIHAIESHAAPSPLLQRYMIDHHPEDFIKKFNNFGITEQSYYDFFVKHVIKGNFKHKMTSFLSSLLHDKNLTDKNVFLKCFARLSNKDAMEFIRNGMPHLTNPEMIPDMIKLKPAIQPLIASEAKPA